MNEPKKDEGSPSFLKSQDVGPHSAEGAEAGQPSRLPQVGPNPVEGDEFFQKLTCEDTGAGSSDVGDAE